MTTRRPFAWLLSAVVLALGLAASAQDKKDKKDEERKGTVTGGVTAKGEDKSPGWVEVKADGEEKARKYVPHWRGGNPPGGGLDKEMVAELKKVAVGSRVRVEWVADERVRVDKIEVLKKGDSEKK